MFYKHKGYFIWLKLNLKTLASYYLFEQEVRLFLYFFSFENFKKI